MMQVEMDAYTLAKKVCEYSYTNNIIGTVPIILFCLSTKRVCKYSVCAYIMEQDS